MTAGSFTKLIALSLAFVDLSAATPTSAMDCDVATPTSADSILSLGRALAQVIPSDLESNGLSRPAGPGGLPEPGLDQVHAPDHMTSTTRGNEMLVQGYVCARMTTN